MSELLEAIQDAVVEGEDERAPKLVEQALGEGLPPFEILNEGVIAGITRVGDLWKANDFFLPDVVLAADAFKAAMVPLEPRIIDGGGQQPGKKYVIGVVEGDVHDMGKGLVVSLLQSSGFKVIDLGINVPTAIFIEMVKVHQPVIIGIGAYMTTTMLEMKNILTALEAEGLRTNMHVMVGGVPTSQEFADEIGADAWGKDALDTRQKAMELVGG